MLLATCSQFAVARSFSTSCTVRLVLSVGRHIAVACKGILQLAMFAGHFLWQGCRNGVVTARRYESAAFDRHIISWWCLCGHTLGDS